MLSDIFDCEASLGVSVQNFLDQVLAGSGDEAWDQVVTVQYLFVQSISIWIFKRQVATGHSIKNDAAAPNIRIEAIVPLSSNHFWSCIARTSTCCLQSLSFLIGVGEAEVDNFDVIFVIQEQILGFEISMADFNLVYVFNPRDYLLEKLAAFLLLKAFPLHNIVEELTAPSIFHDQEQLLRSFYNLHPH